MGGKVKERGGMKGEGDKGKGREKKWRREGEWKNFVQLRFVLSTLVMAAYRRVYDSRHLQADCQEPVPAPEPYAPQSSMD